jgi:hypothetical protein
MEQLVTDRHVNKARALYYWLADKQPQTKRVRKLQRWAHDRWQLILKRYQRQAKYRQGNGDSWDGSEIIRLRKRADEQEEQKWRFGDYDYIERAHDGLLGQ